MVANYLVIRYKLSSLIVIMLAVVFSISLVLVGKITATMWMDAVATDTAFVLKNICA